MTFTPRMPDGLRLARTTAEFTDATTPAGLRRAHRVAPGVWGRLRVLEGTIRFVFEPTSANSDELTSLELTSHELASHELVAGQAIDIPPDTAHRVEPGPGCRFVVEFHEPGSG